jgi:predicted anti-sigma-YlaC factor YlaD
VECTIAREALSARLDGEREPVPAMRVDEHLDTCGECRAWYEAAVEQTRSLRRLAGRSQVAAVPPPRDENQAAPRRTPVPWRRWALGAVGMVQLGVALAQGLGAHVGMPTSEVGGHLLNESTAWSASLGVVMIAVASRPVAAAGLAWVLAAFAGILGMYEVADAVADGVTGERIVSHLPVLAGAVLAWLVWRGDRPTGPEPVPTASGDDAADIVLPDNATRGRRRGHLYPTDGSAA